MALLSKGERVEVQEEFSYSPPWMVFLQENIQIELYF